MSIPKDNAAPAARTDKSSKEIVWGELVPKEVGFEDTTLPFSVEEGWRKIYKEVGVTDEYSQAEVRLAVYVYGALNGTSREGSYEGTITTKSGKRFSANVLPYALNRTNIRRFMRANMDESYLALKGSGALVTNDRFMSRITAQMIPIESYMASCDWLKDCPRFTPQEATHNVRVFAAKRDAADASRGGTLESVEQKRFLAAEGVEANGGDAPSAAKGTSIW